MTPTASTRVRQRIARLLDDRGQTQRSLARALGHGDQWASNLLSGRSMLAWDDLDKVAAFLNVPPSELVRVSDDPWELTPTEMRAIRAMRMLPPSVRDHLVTLADYLVGTTPDEVEILKQVRELSDENRRLVERWIDVTLRGQGTESRQVTPDDLRETAAPRVAPIRHTRHARAKSPR